MLHGVPVSLNLFVPRIKWIRAARTMGVFRIGPGSLQEFPISLFERKNPAGILGGSVISGGPWFLHGHRS